MPNVKHYHHMTGQPDLSYENVDHSFKEFQLLGE